MVAFAKYFQRAFIDYSIFPVRFEYGRFFCLSRVTLNRFNYSVAQLECLWLFLREPIGREYWQGWVNWIDDVSGNSKQMACDMGCVEDIIHNIVFEI